MKFFALFIYRPVATILISLAIPFVIYGLRKHWAPKTPVAPATSAPAEVPASGNGHTGA